MKRWELNFDTLPHLKTSSKHGKITCAHPITDDTTAPYGFVEIDGVEHAVFHSPDDPHIFAWKYIVPTTELKSR